MQKIAFGQTGRVNAYGTVNIRWVMRYLNSRANQAKSQHTWGALMMLKSLIALRQA